MRRGKQRQGVWLLSVLMLGLVIVFMDRFLHEPVQNPETKTTENRQQKTGENSCEPETAGPGIRALSDETVRAMDFGRQGFAGVLSWAQACGEEPGEALAVWMSGLRYTLSGITGQGLSRQGYEELEKQRDAQTAGEGGEELRRQYEQLRQIYGGLAADLQVFPIPRNTDASCAFVRFGNDWGNPRTFGGERRHEGCDIMGDCYEDGTYPVLSMTDGVVEQLGWLKLGGWRIGIRSDSGIYYYYAHLASYADGIEIGDRVRAGDVLGYMGSTGYSTVEGTSGKFAVHLHVGIYVTTQEQEELSVNPYYLMRYLENGHVLTQEYPFTNPPNETDD